MRKHQKNGFTLVELIIVIAIMAVLAAVLTPQYLKYVDKSRQTVCLSNREEILHEMQIGLLDESGDTAETLFSEIMAREKGKDLCPAGGTFQLKTSASGQPTISCSKHDALPHQFGGSDTMSAVIAAMKKATATRLDSGAAVVSSTSKSAKILDELKKSGIDLNAMGAAAWSYKNSVLIWTQSDISSLKTGDTVPAIQYNSKTGNYTVWVAKVTDNIHTGTSQTAYTIIDPSSYYSPSAITDKGNQTYDQALKRYEELKKTMKSGN